MSWGTYLPNVHLGITAQGLLLQGSMKALQAYMGQSCSHRCDISVNGGFSAFAAVSRALLSAPVCRATEEQRSAKHGRRCSLTGEPLMCVPATEFTRGEGCATGASSSLGGEEGGTSRELTHRLPVSVLTELRFFFSGTGKQIPRANKSKPEHPPHTPSSPQHAKQSEEQTGLSLLSCTAMSTKRAGAGGETKMLS